MEHEALLARITELEIELDHLRREKGHMHRIAAAITTASSVPSIAEIIVRECKSALGADSICLYLLKGHQLEMITEVGCTDRFKQACKVIPKNLVPRITEVKQGVGFFYGTANEFIERIPDLAPLVKSSGRHTIGYASLIVNNKNLGFVGFAYNSQPKNVLDKDFIFSLMKISAQGLDRLQLFEQERVARHEAISANRAKSEFIANINHEIRSPIGVIQGFADLLSNSTDLSPSSQKWARIIRRNTEQLAQLIGDVLDIAKIEADKIEVRRELFSLMELLESLRQDFQPRATAKNIVLSIEPKEIPELINSDPVKIRQILANLIGNAIKFTDEGFVRVSVSLSLENKIEFLVADCGSGIPKRFQSKIFQPFVRASRRHNYTEGTGLGLAIASRLAKCLNGEITLVSSNLNRGSTFLFSLECTAGAPIPMVVSSTSFNSKPQMLSGTRILVVDDSPDNLELFEFILQEAGAEVLLTWNAAQAIETTSNEEVDIVVMDIKMPKMSGHQAVQALRNKGFDRPIIALTANALASEREICLKEGFSDYLTKPVNKNELVRTIYQLVNA